MNQGLAVIFPMLFFAILDLVIIYNVYKYKNNLTTRTIFLFMTAANFVQQLCGAISYMFDYRFVYAPAAVQYVLYLCLFTAMAVTAYEWFVYLQMLLAGKENLSKGIKHLIASPVAVLFSLTAASPWTHWIVWISTDGIYQRGTLSFMQFVCTFIYVVFAIAALIFYIKRGTSVYRKRVYSNFIMFIFPAVLGSVLQLTVFQGGYTMIGISIAVIFMYLDLYVDEVNENQRLQLEALEQKQLLQEALIRAANTDALTNLMNRSAYEAELNSADIVFDDLVYIAFDVNGLKYVNDHLGHAAGDELLIGAADCMQKCFGKYGKIFRTGGDEFVAIIHISMEELEEAGKEFEELVGHWSGKLVTELHVAVGYVAAVQDHDCENLQRMSVLADQRMYADKAEYYRQSGIDRRKC